MDDRRGEREGKDAALSYDRRIEKADQRWDICGSFSFIDAVFM